MDTPPSSCSSDSSQSSIFETHNFPIRHAPTELFKTAHLAVPFHKTTSINDIKNSEVSQALAHGRERYFEICIHAQLRSHRVFNHLCRRSHRSDRMPASKSKSRSFFAPQADESKYFKCKTCGVCAWITRDRGKAVLVLNVRYRWDLNVEEPGNWWLRCARETALDAGFEGAWLRVVTEEVYRREVPVGLG